IDTMVMPEIEYGYYVVALYNGNPSPPSLTIYITVPTPSDLEPLDLEAIMHYPGDFDVTLLWEEPVACLSPDGYKIFRNDEQINLTLVTETTYIDPSLTYGFYEYYVTAVYYFGESDPSNLTYALFYGTDEWNLQACQIFPNPSNDVINIEAGYPIDRIQIFDIRGRHLLSKTINQKKIQIDVSRFESGIYFISLEIEEKTILRKIVVE
ncbi:MAG: T9SS type A sorting domain-containing protein, partial [Bacteroidales bacterium]|nr:T9SS type A sorting domain-containing protein [Bacteroidales bacterium]